MTSLSARLPAELSALDSVRSTLSVALRSEGWTDGSAGRVLTASTEALANAVEHGSKPGAGVDVAFTVSMKAASVRVLDQGRAQDRRQQAETDAPEVTSTHGRGRLLMRALADQVQIRPRGAGTEVVLGFRSASE
jgi:anti-sigma regulatory factor (Ser/Thr protein kinase)